MVVLLLILRWVEINEAHFDAHCSPRRDSNGRRSLGRDSLSSLKSARSGGERTKELKQTSRHNLTGVAPCTADQGSR